MRKTSGQALLIILLIMAVVLTIALSIISRSVSDITISQKEEEAARAYSAAEAGVERALESGTAVDSSFSSGDRFTAQVSALANQTREFLVPLLMSSGETTPVWFISHNQDGDLTCSQEFPCFIGTKIKACWGEEGTQLNELTPALEISIIHTSTSDYSTAKVARSVLDPHNGRVDNNNFPKGSDGPCTIEDKNMAFSKIVDLATLGVSLRSSVDSLKGPQIARLRLLYNTDRAHSVGVAIEGQAGIFPQQGNKVEATGVSGQSTRKVQVYQLYPDLPPVFDFGIFAGTGGIIK